MGLIGLGGHAQTIRPLITPMTEGASQNRYGPLPKSIIAGLSQFSNGKYLQKRCLLDSIGWAAILPMMLAMLGGIFTAAQTVNSI
ncbi:hypothetical protein JCM31447_04380 [Fluviispira sanaruensis]|uniref:Uncharacterized protein n=1 Tax=Fluviispira sanaruensis TaxID=2493639 RepID=A0A4P2VH55_FLUSA|nr:hypothetical protein JCM31447_04380 [Fluviispira sanaruensis]